MLPNISLFSILWLSTSGLAAALPRPRSASSVNLPLTRRINTVQSARQNVVQIDQSRAQALGQRVLNLSNATGIPHDDSPKSITNTTNAVVTYSASVDVGSPATKYNLILDTGSSNTWVGAGKQYVHTNTSNCTRDVVVVMYGSGFFTGLEYTDQVSFTSSLVIDEQSIGVATISKGFQDFDGILGIGPTDLTVGTLVPDRGTAISTVVDNLYDQRAIPEAVLGISFNPISSSDPGGVLSFGGTDATRYTGNITYTPVTSTSPASAYWGIDITAAYGTTVVMQQTAGIVDTGTTLILLPSDTYQAYKSATGAVEDNNTGLLEITSDQYAALQNFVVTINGTAFELTPNAQIWPRSLNTAIGGTEGAIYLAVGDIGSLSGSGLGFILGYTFLERFYSVYDTTHHRVGIATTSFTTSDTN